MKTALLRYWLTNMRGGENVFRRAFLRVVNQFRNL